MDKFYFGVGLAMVTLVAGVILGGYIESPKTRPSFVYKQIIDGHDYLLSEHGGIIHSLSCQCKTNRPPMPPGFNMPLERQ